MVGSVLENLKASLTDHTLHVKYAADLPPVKIDAEIIKQILAILLSNAVAYTPKNASISLSVQKDQEKLVIGILDQGPGIPDEDLDKIFEKFYRGKMAKPGGLGLGLSIAKRFVHAHGGQIKVRNQEKGGAHFSVELPVDFFHEHDKVSS